MKAEYIPPREDVVMQNEVPDDVYVIVSGEVEIIDCKMEKELVVGTLHSGEIFGEVGALCCRPQGFTYRTKTLSQLLRLKTTALIEAMQTKKEDNIQMLNNFLQVIDTLLFTLVFSEEEINWKDGLLNVMLYKMQHHKKLNDLKIGELLVEVEEDSDPNMADNLLTVASTGNAVLLDELLKAKLDPDIADSKGRTPLVCV